MNSPRPPSNLLLKSASKLTEEVNSSLLLRTFFSTELRAEESVLSNEMFKGNAGNSQVDVFALLQGVERAAEAIVGLPHLYANGFVSKS